MPGRRGPRRDDQKRTVGNDGLETSGRDSDANDAALVASMRRGDPRACEAFLERFHRVLLDYARRGGVTSADRDEFVEQLLDDLAMEFMMPGRALPSNPRMYVLAAFRKKLLNLKRARGRLERAIRNAASEHGRVDGTEVIAGCSQRMVQESLGPGWERATLLPALERLSTQLAEKLTDDERLLLDAVAENVPQREIAEWLGVSHAVARKRLERLRARLVVAAMRYANGLEPDDARELQRFFRRCRARIGASVTADPLEARPGAESRREQVVRHRGEHHDES